MARSSTSMARGDPRSALATVVMRAKDEAPAIASALDSVRRQTVESEVIVVDSGSSDSTIEIASDYCDRVISIPPDEFTFGHALNVGAVAASNPVIVALSAHCALPDKQWLERCIRHFERPDVAAACGLQREPNGTLLANPRDVTWDDVASDPHWGLSNHASAWRREAWRDIPFDAGARSAEDKLWMWQAMRSGWTVVVDPSLHVPAPWRRDQGLRRLWERVYWEHWQIAVTLGLPAPPLRATAGKWWSDFLWPSPRPAWQRRLSPWRTVEIVAGAFGEWRGSRAGDREHL